MPFVVLAAAAVVVAAAVIATAVAIVVAAPHITAAVAEQQDQDDDPANVTTAETVIVTHNTLPPKKIFSGIYRSFQDIPAAEFGAEKAGEEILSGIICFYAGEPSISSPWKTLRTSPSFSRMVMQTDPVDMGPW